MAEKDYWKQSEIQVLRTLHANGKLFREIAKALPGRSKAACISKAHKLGIYGHDGPVKRRQQAERLRAQRALSIVPMENHP